MRITVGGSHWLRYLLLDPTTGLPVTGLTYDQIKYWVCMPGTEIFQQAAISSDMFEELNKGVYAVQLHSDYTSDVGAITTILEKSTDASIVGRREDEITNYDPDIAQGYSIRIYALDESDIGVPNAQIQVRNSTATLTLEQKTTGTDGYADFFVPEGVYKVYVWAVGYVWTYPESITVSGNSSFLLYGETVLPGVPSAPELCLVTGTLLDTEGNPRENVTVSFELIRPAGTKPCRVTTTGQIVTRTVQTCTTDANGAFSISLIPNDDITPTNTRYIVRIDDQVEETCSIVLTEAGGTQDISDLL